MSDCVLSNLAQRKDGYCKTTMAGKTVLAHRLAYVRHHKLKLADIEGQLVLHSCDVRNCVNPEHLSLGTHKDNSQDMVRKGRWNSTITDRRGSSNGNSKVSEDDVRSIRKLYEQGAKLAEIATQFNIAVPTAHQIGSRASWSHVKD